MKVLLYGAFDTWELLRKAFCPVSVLVRVVLIRVKYFEQLIWGKTIN